MNRRWFVPALLSSTICDMGFGKAFGNLIFGINVNALWYYGSDSSYVVIYGSKAFPSWLGDVIIGFIAGCLGVWLFTYSLWRVFK